MDIFCRGVKPFPPLSPPEICFWLRIMREHALFIELGLPGDAAELRIETKRFFDVFAELQTQAGAAVGGEEFARLARAAAATVRRFFFFNRLVLHCLLECRLDGGCLTPLFVDHLSREALYFLKLLRKLQSGDMPCAVDAVVSENGFWARISGDHLAFTRAMIDPAERGMIAQAGVVGEKLDRAGVQARDLASMLWHFQPTNELIRFERDFRLAAEEVQAFFTAVKKMTAHCSALAAMEPLVADHIRREGEHFLGVLELIRAYLLRSGERSADSGAG